MGNQKPIDGPAARDGPTKRPDQADVLARMAAVLLDVPPEEEIFRVVGEGLRELVGDCIVTVCAYEPRERSLRLAAVAAEAELREAVARLTGGDLAWPVEDRAIAALSGRPVWDAGGMDERTVGPCPPGLRGDAARALGVQHVYTVGFAARGQLYGGAAILVRGAAPPPDRVAIEALVCHAAAALVARGAEKRLEDAEQRHRELVELLPLGVVEADLADHVTFANRYALAMAGYEPADVGAGLTTMQTVAPEDRERARQQIAAVVRGEQLGAGEEYHAVRKDGRPFDIAIYSTPMRCRGRLVGMRAVVVDITARKRAEEALRQSERRYRELVELLPVVVVECDLTGAISFANSRLAEMTGYGREELVPGRNLAELVVPAQREQVRAALAAAVRGEVDHGREYTAQRKDGGTVDVVTDASPIVDGGKPTGVRGIAIDVTAHKRAEEERRQLEAQMQHAQKLESLGVLAGGIAHDFNNLLVAMLGNAELALTRLVPGSFVHEHVQKVRKAAGRAAELTNQMLAYSGRGHFKIEELDLNEVVQEMGGLVRAAIARTGTLRYELAVGLPHVEADATQIRQVLMNLIINASDALEGRPGTITVRSGLVRADRALLARMHGGADLQPGPYVCLEVSDTGSGMDAETLPRIFDPFFTTKFTGRGLGLAAVLGIVRGHGGAIAVESAPAEGAVFTILLPALERPAEEAARAPQPGVAGAWRGSGTVLVVDDEEGVRDVAGAVLEGVGFRVLAAADGRDGVRLLREHADEVVAVVLDLTMPVMDGEEAFREMRRVSSRVPIILTSGYSEQQVIDRFAGADLAGAIQKPFTIEQLVAKLRAAVEGTKGGA